MRPALANSPSLAAAGSGVALHRLTRRLDEIIGLNASWVGDLADTCRRRSAGKFLVPAGVLDVQRLLCGRAMGTVPESLAAIMRRNHAQFCARSAGSIDRSE